MGPHCLDALDILRKPRPPNPHFDGPKSLFEVAVSLSKQRVEAEVEIDTASVAGDLIVVATEKAPKVRIPAMVISASRR